MKDREEVIWDALVYFGKISLPLLTWGIIFRQVGTPFWNGASFVVALVLTVLFIYALHREAEDRKASEERHKEQYKEIRELGTHPGGKAVKLMQNPYGFYVSWDGNTAALPDRVEPADITYEQALDLIDARIRHKEGYKKIRELGSHPDGGAIKLMRGRYGHYISWARINATLPRHIEPADLTFEQALDLINSKAAKNKP